MTWIKTVPLSEASVGALMSPDLPLTRRQHEMITTVVSVTKWFNYINRVADALGVGRD